MANQPKKYKKFVASAATATLVASAIVPVASAATPTFSDIAGNDHEKAIEAIYALGLISGKADGTFAPNESVTRSQVALMLGRLAESQGVKAPEDYKTVQRFKDVPLTSDETLLKYTALVKDAGIFVGSNGNLNGADKIQRQHMAVTLNSAYKAITGKSLVELAGDTSDVTVGDLNKVSADYRSQVLALKKLGITAPANFNPTGQVTRGQFATFLNATINAKAPVDNSKPAVQSVSALNATQVEVKFTQEVDKNSAQTLANYSIGANNPTTAELQADGKTVKLTFSSPTHVEVTNAVLVVEEISTKADTTVKTAKYSQIFTYEDKVKPELVSVEAKTNGTVATSVTVKASEPIQNALVKINGEYKAISFAGTDKATITGLSLDVTKSHTIELINLTDKGNNITVTTSKTFNVEKDTVSPTVTLSAKSDKQILLTFSKSMDVATVTAALAANSAVKDEAFNTVNHNVAAVVADSDNKQFTIDLTSTLYTNKDSRNLTVVLPNTIKDSIGNTITTATQQVTLTKDTVKPVATGYKVIKNSAGEVTDLEVTFSEELIANATPSAPTIVDSNGVIVTLLGGITGDAVVTGDKKVTYSFTTPAKLSGTYNFSFPVDLVTDRAETGNKSAAFGYNVDFGAASGTFKVTSATASSNVITVVFPKAVKGGAVANSATDLNNYTLAGKALPADTTITLSADQKTATITLKSGAVEKTDGSAILTVSNIRSTDGDSLESYTGTVSVDDNTQPVLNSATLTADNKLSVGFNEDLNTTPAAADFVIKINSKTVALTGTSTLTVTAGAGSDAGKYLINLGDLVKQGNAASAGVDGVLGTADDVAATPTYVDVNNDGTYNTNDDIKIGDGPFTDFKFSSSSAITGVTVSTIDSGATTGKDAKNNTLKNGVTVTAK